MTTATKPKAPTGGGWGPVGGSTMDWGDKPGTTIQGVYVSRRQVTANGKTTYLNDLRQSDGKVIAVWDTAVLAQKFTALDPDGTWEVFIGFTGFGKRKGKNNPPRLFDFQARKISKRK